MPQRGRLDLHPLHGDVSQNSTGIRPSFTLPNFRKVAGQIGGSGKTERNYRRTLVLAGHSSQWFDIRKSSTACRKLRPPKSNLSESAVDAVDGSSSIT
jgi:hypothetical protein